MQIPDCPGMPGHKRQRVHEETHLLLGSIMFHAALKTYMFVNETVAKNGNMGRKTWRDMLNIYSALPAASD